jgi:hypothetical protein
MGYFQARAGDHPHVIIDERIVHPRSAAAGAAFGVALFAFFIGKLLVGKQLARRWRVRTARQALP